MHRKVFIVLLGLALIGCSTDQYAIERQYWQIQRQAEKIFKNPQASPPNELERVVGLFNKFIQNYPKDNLSTEAEFNIARLYIVKEEYDKARTQLKTIIDKHGQSEGICAEAIFLNGNSYQVEDKWGLALEQYKKIMQEYPITLRGIDIPVYIAQYYKAKYQPDRMMAAYQEAISHYRALADKYPDSPLAYKLDSLVAQCYIALKEWQNAIASFNSIIEKYKGKVNNVDALLLDIALIYHRELKDKAKAKETLERFIQDYPNSKLIKTATALLKEWGENE